MLTAIPFLTVVVSLAIVVLSLATVDRAKAWASAKIILALWSVNAALAVAVAGGWL